jgi:RimJ/RimL family protein N-acetyltransferase
MSKTQPVTVNLRPWSNEDLPLLERLMGDPAKTGHLGGPETPEQIRARHERYVRTKETSRQGPIYAITIGPGNQAVGSIGYWQRPWQGQQIWEVRWSLLPEFQGRGIVAGAMKLLAEHARKVGRARFLHAFPAADNEWANGVCRDSGFELLGEVEFEVGPGHTRRRNDWRLDLFAAVA